MNTTRLKGWAKGAAAALLLTFLFIQQKPADSRQHDRFTGDLQKLKQLDAEFTRDVLSARYDLLNSYDSFAQKLEAMHKISDRLKRVPTYISVRPRAQLQELVRNESNLLARKAALVETFKSKNAILKNSQQYFPLLVAEASQAKAGAKNKQLHDHLANLLRDILIYNLKRRSDSDTALKEEMEVIAGDAARYPGLRDTLSNVGAHARTIVTTKPQVEDVTGELISLPTSFGLDAIFNAYMREYSRGLKINELYRLLLFLCAVCLVGSGVNRTASSVKSRKGMERANQDLNDANGLLVQAKQELQATNQTIETTLAELRIAQERYELAVRGANDGLWDWDLATGEMYCSPRWKEMLGVSPEECSNVKAAWAERLHPEDRERVEQEWREHFANRSPVFESEHRMRHNDGTFRWVLSRGMAVRTPDGQARRMAGSQTDITGNKSNDPLTGLANRLLFSERLSQAIQRRAGSRIDYAVLFLDVDRFKIVNDSLGHLAGDTLLRQIADRLRKTIRSTDTIRRLFGGSTVARLGGDEFAVLIENLNDAASARVIANRILADFEAPFQLNGREIFSTFSVGVAVGSTGYIASEDVIRDADIAMYEAKASGKARAAVFDQGMRTRAVERMEVEAAIRAGIEREEFTVFYQPKVELDSGEILGFEALVRWQHPVRGLIPPAQFIPIAEETGLIVPLGYWVLRQACGQLQEWQRLHADRNLTVSVNISGRQFAEPDLVERIAGIVGDSGISARSLDLELTETIVMQNPEAASATLSRLKAMGIGLDMDDFGTGYSSLSYLQRFPFDTLKIDKSFIYGLGNGSENRELIRTIVEMAKNFHMRVVAEGVETDLQVTELKALGCHQGQGYLFSKPVEPSIAGTMIADRKGKANDALTRIELSRLSEARRRFPYQASIPGSPLKVA